MAEKTGGPLGAGTETPQLDVYTLGDGTVDRRRLDRITEIFRPTTLAVLDRVGVRPGMACLDVGCGTGGVAFDLARRVGPEGRVVRLDMDDLSAAFDRAVELVSEERRRTGGFPDIGARLPVLFQGAGLADVRMSIFQHMELEVSDHRTGNPAGCIKQHLSGSQSATLH